MDQLLWWATVLPVTCYSSNRLWWRSQLILGTQQAWVPRCTLVLQWRGERSGRKAPGTLVREQASAGRDPFPKRKKFISFPLAWTHQKANGDRCQFFLAVFSMCCVISHLLLWRPLPVCVGESMSCFSLCFRGLEKLITWLLKPLRIYFKFRASRGSTQDFKLMSSIFSSHSYSRTLTENKNDIF